MDGAHRHRRVQPLARRVLRQHRPHRPELPALAEQRPPEPVAGARSGLLWAPGQPAARAGARVELLRRHPDAAHRRLLALGTSHAAGDQAGARRHGAARRVGHRGVHRARPVRVRARAGARAHRDTGGDPARGRRARRVVRAEGQGAPVRGRDPHGARAGADGDRAGEGRRGADRPLRRVPAAADARSRRAEPDVRGRGAPHPPRSRRDHAGGARAERRSRVEGGRTERPGSAARRERHADAPAHRHPRGRHADQQPPVFPPRLDRGDPLRAARPRAAAPSVGTTRGGGRRALRGRRRDRRSARDRLYRPARLEVRGADVRTAPGLCVGYVMGVGDQVPRRASPSSEPRSSSWKSKTSRPATCPASTPS